MEDIGRRVNRFVDCYVSTDAGEVGHILVQLGFRNMACGGTERQTLRDAYAGLAGSSLKHAKTGIEIDCVDVPMHESLERGKEIGFMPMSKFRVYTKGSPNAARILLPMMRALDGEQQNMAFIDDAGSVAYRKISALYR